MTLKPRFYLLIISLSTFLAGCGTTLKDVTTVSSVETRPTQHYIELLGKQSFLNEKQFPEKLDRYSRTLCGDGYTVSQTRVGARLYAKLPVTSCGVNACASHELLTAVIQCNSSAQSPVYTGGSGRWVYPSRDQRLYQKLRRSVTVIEAELQGYGDPEKILLGTELMIWVYPNHYAVLKTVKRPFGTAPVELQIRKGQPNIQ